MTGFLNIDKEEGYSSTYVVNVAKRITRTPCGHMGTLDPLASGVLPVGIGNATRLFDFFLEKEKRYTAKFRFGVTTDTLDREGELRYGGTVPTEAEIRAALPNFLGEIEQVPPKFSAACVGGKRGYELARAGADFELKGKKVKISAFELLEQTAKDEFLFDITCGGGTYIRSLVRDLAYALGTVGYMSYLRRKQSGAFTLENAVKLQELTPETVEKYLIPTDLVLDLPSLDLDEKRLYDGLSVPCEKADGLYKLYRRGVFYGLARVQEGAAKTEKKLC